jgi:hypothetical protein
VFYENVILKLYSVENKIETTLENNIQTSIENENSIENNKDFIDEYMNEILSYNYFAIVETKYLNPPRIYFNNKKSTFNFSKILLMKYNMIYNTNIIDDFHSVGFSTHDFVIVFEYYLEKLKNKIKFLNNESLIIHFSDAMDYEDSSVCLEKIDDMILSLDLLSVFWKITKFFEKKAFLENSNNIKKSFYFSDKIKKIGKK